MLMWVGYAILGVLVFVLFLLLLVILLSQFYNVQADILTLLPKGLTCQTELVPNFHHTALKIPENHTETYCLRNMPSLFR